MPTYWQDLATLAAGAVLLAGLARVAVHDARDLAIPDRLSLPLIALGLAVGWARGGLTDAVIGALAGYLAFVAVEKTYLAIRRAPGLGRDDAKLFAVGGAWCGWVALPQILLIAAAAAILYQRHQFLTLWGFPNRF